MWFWYCLYCLVWLCNIGFFLAFYLFYLHLVLAVVQNFGAPFVFPVLCQMLEAETFKKPLEQIIDYHNFSLEQLFDKHMIS